MAKKKEMTEKRWKAATSPTELLAFLGTRISERKFRLFACACWRLMWNAMQLPAWRYRLAPDLRAIEIVERYADELESSDRLESVRAALLLEYHDKHAMQVSPSQASHLCVGEPTIPYHDSCRLAARSAAVWASYFSGVDLTVEEARQAQLLRDICGPLPIRGVQIEDQWLAWNEGAIAKMAEVIYAMRGEFEGKLVTASLVALADALEAAGCTDADILGHLRAPGPHVSGCWAIDLITNRW